MAKLASIVGYRAIEIRDYPVPEPFDDGLIIKTEAAGICGSDWHVFNRQNITFPGLLGHEFTGRIVKMGPHAGNSIYCFNGTLEAGDRIAVFPWITCNRCSDCLKHGSGVCFVCKDSFIYGGSRKESQTPLNHNASLFPHFKGGFGEYVHIFSGTYVWKLPDDMSPAVASLLDPLAVAVKAIEHATTPLISLWEGVNTSTQVIISGGTGCIGMLTAIVLRTMGVERIYLTGQREKKIQRALEITGADEGINLDGLSSEQRVKKTLEITGGADLVINCANQIESTIEALQMVKMLGTYVEIGNATRRPNEVSNVEINIPSVLFQKNAHITGVVAVSPKTYDRAFHLLTRNNMLGFDKLITHYFHSLEELQPTMFKMRDEDYLKGVLVFP